MKKFNLGSMKGNLPHMERFARRYVMEGLTALAIVVGGLSAWMHMFWGTMGWSILFLVIGSVCGLFWSKPMDVVLKKIYSFSSGNKTMMIVSECVKILVALFVPFIYFAFLGSMAGTAYQYYVHYMHSESKGSKAA